VRDGRLAVFLGVPAIAGSVAARGILPRIRPILPGETMVSDYNRSHKCLFGWLRKYGTQQQGWFHEAGDLMHPVYGPVLESAV
jgi:hypothetical protein